MLYINSRNKTHKEGVYQVQLLSSHSISETAEKISKKKLNFF
jgi:hypothetical protein